MPSDSEEIEGGDVRAALARCLRWEASYAAADRSEARCFVARDADSVGEWLVRRIGESPSDSARAPAPAPATTTAKRRRGLETQLQHELRLLGARAESLEEAEVPTEELRDPLARLACLYAAIPRFAVNDGNDPAEMRTQLHTGCATAASAHLSTLRGLCEAPSSGERFAVLEYEKFALLDVLKHNRHVLHADGDVPAQGEELALADLKKRFLIYQLHRILQFLHQRGLACGGFTPSDILLTDTLWVRLGTLPFAGKSEWDAECCTTTTTAVYRSVSSFDSRSITERWCDGDVSNLEYLMVLNTAAGRRMVDGVFHPFLPWVTDFHSRDTGWRDLTKSKFRLNKGDNQLDRTYENSSIPHHITESLSEITYYIYMARRTPMQVLRQVVRSNFQPKEYPSSMARMYDWTPDECIPEFYTEPSVFKSVREDAMEDLTLPPWCVDAHDFIRSHREMLEGDEVSRQLHHWIDLNFGVSLSGDQAIKQKNVPLKVQRDTRLGKSPGFVQIFQIPHPARRSRVPPPSANVSDLNTQMLQAENADAAVQAHRVHFSASTYRPSEMKTGVEGMLSKALRIVSDSGEGVWGSAPAAFESSSRVLQSRRSMTNLSLAHQGSAESKPQSQSSRLKTKRKTKSRPRSHGSDPPLSPPSNGKDDSMKSPTVSRLATVIPNFFHPDSSFGHSSGSSGGLASSFKMGGGGDATPKATTPVAGNGPRAVSQFADGASAETARIPAPLIHSVVGDAGMPHQLRSTSGGAATSPNTTSHIFRELWQQLSKPDEAEADYVGENSGHHLLDYDYSDADFDRLDEMDLQLLGVGLPIKMTTGLASAEASGADNELKQHEKMSAPASLESSVSPETRAKLRRAAEAIIDPVYSLPHDFVKKTFPDCDVLTAFELRRADDLFALGCVIAEVYTLSPLFSRRAVVEYMKSRSEADHETSSRQDYWGNDIVAKLRRLPGGVKNAVLALVHPNPRERLLMIGVLDGEEVFSILESFQRESGAANPILDLEFSPAQRSLFPSEFALVYRFLSQYHRLSDWKERFDATRLFLPSLVQLPPPVFRVVLPVIAQFFQAASHTESIQVERVAAAVVFLLPSLGTQLGRLGLKQELLRDVLRAYESSDVSHLLKICLAAPEVLKQVVKSFGNNVFIESFLPVLVDWTVSTHEFGAGDAALLPTKPSAEGAAATRAISRTPLFASEASSIVVTALGELSSSAILGPSLATKYVLASLLPHLGKMKSKWTKLTTPTVLKRMGSTAYGKAVDDSSDDLLSGQNSDGIHVTFLSKTSLYEPHCVADAVLVVCREVGDYPVRTVLLPHVFEVLPQLILLAEKIGSVRVEGVPEDLGREVYVTLRILRHVVRNSSEASVQSEFLDRKGAGLIAMLDAVEPPFLHPRTAAAITAAATSSTLTDSAAKQSILRSLSFMKRENHRNLRAFIAVGLARTIVALCQKIGPAATTSAASLVQGINKFLTRCGAVYSELEVSNFQWHVASEVVSEFCIPLRNLLGRDAFAKHFPVVHSSTVLQLLLLPIGGIDRNAGVQLDVPDAQQSSSSSALLVDKERTCPDETLRAIARCPPDLLHFAYRATRLNAVRAPSFLQIPRSRLNPNLQDLNDEIFRVQESRRRRQAALALSTPTQRLAADSAWLRALVKRPFTGKQAASEQQTADAAAATLSSRSAFFESWAFAGEIWHSIKAHSSSVRCVSVDLDEELVLSGSKSGSCRAWRLASHPCHAQAAVHASAPILAVQNAMDGVHALALEAACVHVWDIRTSQVRVKLPFPDESAVALTLLRTLPAPHPHVAGSPFGASATLGDADFAVATTRKAVCVDLRVGPRVVADWRVDVHDAAVITALATLFSPSSRSDAFIAAGTATGAVIAIDRRTGRHVAKWQALDGSRVVKLAQISPSQLLVVGVDREARVWHIARLATPRVQLAVLGVPEGVRESQVAVQAFADMVVLYAASANKLLAARLPSERDAAESLGDAAVPSVRMETWPLLEPAASSSLSLAAKLGKSKVAAQSVCVLPLRRVVVLGSDDGFLKCVA